MRCRILSEILFYWFHLLKNNFMNEAVADYVFTVAPDAQLQIWLDISFVMFSVSTKNNSAAGRSASFGVADGTE